MLKQIVRSAQGLALLGIGLFVVCLFAIGAKDRVIAGYNSTGGPDGAQIFAANCARCHGAGGDGGTAPRLAGQVELMFPNIDDQVAYVTQNPPSGMPDFGVGDPPRLTPEEIQAVVEFTRAL